MRQLHVRLTEEVGKLLQEFADARGISLNAAAAVIIYEKLADGASALSGEPQGNQDRS